jgi:hypothetical protein
MLEFFDGYLGQFHGLSMNHRPFSGARFQRIQLPTAEGSDVVDPTGINPAQKRTSGNGTFFLLFHIFGKFFLDIDLIRFAKGFHPFVNDKSFQGNDIHMAKMDATKGTTRLTDSI